MSTDAPDIVSAREGAKRLREELGLGGCLVGVRFVSAGSAESVPDGTIRLEGHRYCQAVMEARRGAHVLLDAEGIACPAAAAAFGFRPLPEGLKNGRGLVGFGIVDDEGVGRAMFEGMPTLPQGTLRALYLFPMETAVTEPNVVVAEDEPEKLMWIALAYLNVQGGRRLETSTAILQAACVDATLIPHVTQRLNMSMGCYGCRDATDIGPGEAVLGLPFGVFSAVVDKATYLNQKAIPNSRRRGALGALVSKGTTRRPGLEEANESQTA